MRIDKLLLTISVAIGFVIMAHSAVAADKAIDQEIQFEAKNLEKAVIYFKKDKPAPAKSIAPKITPIKKKTAQRKIQKPKTVKKAQPAPISNLVADNSKKARRTAKPAAKSGLSPVWNDVILQDQKSSKFAATGYEGNDSIKMDDGMTKSITKIELPKEKSPSQFSGNVNFSMGSNSNPTPDKDADGYEGTFYQIDPTLGFKYGWFQGTFGAMIRDYTDQEVSNVAKTSEGKAEIGMVAPMSDWAISTTLFGVVYHDERWPDYVNGKTQDPVTGKIYWEGMSNRYTETKLTQKLGFNFGALSTEIGGYALNRDYSSGYSDFSDDLLGEMYYQQDFNEYSGFGRIGLSANEYLEIAARPSVTHKKYVERRARQPDGQKGGLLLSNQTPRTEFVTSELGMDVIGKFRGSSITPTALIGQQSDEALGAEDNSFYGFGVSANFLVLDRGGPKLTIAPSYIYKKYTYDHFTSGIYPLFTNTKRIDWETTTGVKASLMMAKNFGIGAEYQNIKEESNKESDESENYREEIISSSLIFAF